jgi:hypothetical protein
MAALAWRRMRALSPMDRSWKVSCVMAPP